MKHKDTYTLPVGFEEQKAAQVAALFASLNGGRVEKMKLIKLMYLAEREFMRRHGHPMLFDEFYSLEHGPICSSSLNGINMQLSSKAWRESLVKIDDRIVASKTDVKRDDLDYISDAEHKVLLEVWESFGFMDASELRNYTHKNCSEYVDVPNGKRMPITYEDIFRALGFKDSATWAEKVMDTRRGHNMLS